MSKSRSQLHAKALPKGVSRELEALLLTKVRDVLLDVEGLKAAKGISRRVVDRIMPHISDELVNAKSAGRVAGKAEVEGAVPCAVCGKRLVWQQAGNTPRWRHVEPMLRRHIATPRDRPTS